MVSSVLGTRESREGRDSGLFAAFTFPDLISTSVHDLAHFYLGKIIYVDLEFSFFLFVGLVFQLPHP